MRYLMLFFLLIPFVTATARESFPLEKYKPIYFVLGDAKDKSELQLSFKYPLLKNTSFYIGYTQNSKWNVIGPSAPFVTTDYNPDIFYRQNIGFATFDSIDIGFYEHKSNGESGTRSRTIDRSYIRFNNSINLGSFTLNLTNKFFGIYNTENNNKDIRRYTGFFRSKLSLRYSSINAIDKERVYIQYNSGGRYSDNFNLYSLETGLQFRTPVSDYFAPMFLLQYVRGYNHSLLNYNKKQETFRVGLVFYR